MAKAELGLLSEMPKERSTTNATLAIAGTVILTVATLPRGRKKAQTSVPAVREQTIPYGQAGCVPRWHIPAIACGLRTPERVDTRSKQSDRSTFARLVSDIGPKQIVTQPRSKSSA